MTTREGKTMICDVLSDAVRRIDRYIEIYESTYTPEVLRKIRRLRQRMETVRAELDGDTPPQRSGQP